MKRAKKAFALFCLAAFLGGSLGGCVILVPAHPQAQHRGPASGKGAKTGGVVSGTKKSSPKAKADK